MNTTTNYIENYLQTHKRGSLFRHADRFGKIPAIGSAIGAIRIAGSILGMLGAGFVYGGAYFFKNELLKENCLFVHERAIDETIRGIYETFAYGACCEKLGRVVLSKISSKISPVENSHNYFAHGSVFTVDENRRIRYYSKKEITKLKQVSEKVFKASGEPTEKEIISAIVKSTQLEDPNSDNQAKKNTQLYSSRTSTERKQIIADLSRVPTNMSFRLGLRDKYDPTMDTSVYF